MKTEFVYGHRVSPWRQGCFASNFTIRSSILAWALIVSMPLLNKTAQNDDLVSPGGFFLVRGQFGYRKLLYVTADF